MTRIVSDKLGDYDLAYVVSITKVPQMIRLSPTETRETPPIARLHFKGGTTQSTLLDYQDTRDQWLALKAAERHPADEREEVFPTHTS